MQTECVWGSDAVSTFLFKVLVIPIIFVWMWVCGFLTRRASRHCEQDDLQMYRKVLGIDADEVKVSRMVERSSLAGLGSLSLGGTRSTTTGRSLLITFWKCENEEEQNFNCVQSSLKIF